MWAQSGNPVYPTVSLMSFPTVSSPVIYGLGFSVGAGTSFHYPMKTEDSGHTWLPLYVFDAGTPQVATGIAVNPTVPSTVYVSTTLDRGGVWKSTDSGETWTMASSGLPQGSSPVQNLTVAANNPQGLYARVDNLLFVSTDGAATWEQRSTLPGSQPGGVLSLLPTSPTEAYFLTRGAAMFRSMDDGRTWVSQGQITVQGGQVEQRAVAHCIAIDPRDPSIVYVCLGVDGNQELAGTSGYWRSADGGQTWTEVYRVEAVNGASSALVDPSGPVVHLHTGVGFGMYLRSANRGLNFTALHGSSFAPIALDPRDPSDVWANGGSAISRDAGLTIESVDAVFRPTFPKLTDPYRFQVEEGQVLDANLKVVPAEGAFQFSYTAEKADAAPWLTLPSPTGETSGNLKIQLSAAGLSPGTYDVALNLTSPQAAGPGQVMVELEVVSAVSGFDYTLHVVAGGGSGDESPDGTPAKGARLGVLGHIATDPQGNIYFESGYRVRKIDTGGILTTLAGTDSFGGTGDGGPAIQAQLDFIEALAADAEGRVYIASTFPAKIRMIDTDGTIRTILSKANQVQNEPFGSPHGLAVDARGDLYIAAYNGILRWPAGGGQLEVVFGRGNNFGFNDVALGPDGAFYFTDSSKSLVYRYTPGSAVETIAGNGQAGFTGDGVATEVPLNGPSNLVVDADGNVFLVDNFNHLVRVITTDGNLRTIAGGGHGYHYDNVAATDPDLDPKDIALDPQGNPVESDLSRILRLTKDTVPRPRVVQGSFVNAGSNLGELSPGVLFSFYGSHLAKETAMAMGAPWPTTLGGATVTVTGTDVPLFFASPGQINGQLPYGLRVGSTYRATVTVNGLTSSEVKFTIAAASPGILVFGDNRAVVVNPDGSVNTTGTPAQPGAALVAYLTGLGELDNPVETGAAAPSDPLSRPVLPVRIQVGGAECQVLFVGLTPGFVGLAQANFVLPELPPGDYPLTIAIGDNVSNGPVLTVGPG